MERTTVFNDHLTAGQHTANPPSAPSVPGKQIETMRETIPIRKKRFRRKKKKMVACDPETWTANVS